MAIIRRRDKGTLNMHRGRIYFCVGIIIGGLLTGCGETQRADEEVNEGKVVISEELDTEEQAKQIYAEYHDDTEPESGGEDAVSAYQAENNAIDHVWHECNLPQEEWPDYDYFINAHQGHYNLTLENMAAFAVKDYALDSGMDKEEWELKRICYYEGAYQVYVESKTGNELYILLSEGQGIQPDYIIMADIRKGDDADISLYEGEYSYNSMLEWHSYMDWFDGKNTMEERPKLDVIGDLYDSVYGNGILYAIYDYLDITDEDKKSHWEIDSNDTYIGRNGYIACANCNNGVQDIRVLVDVWNKSYAVLIPKETAKIRESKVESVKAEKESLPETDINIYNSFAQIETNGRQKLIEFPSVDKFSKLY